MDQVSGWGPSPSKMSIPQQKSTDKDALDKHETQMSEFLIYGVKAGLVAGAAAAVGVFGLHRYSRILHLAFVLFCIASVLKTFSPSARLATVLSDYSTFYTYS